MVEYGCKIEEKVKAMQSEIKKNIQGINSEGKETGTQINDLEQNEDINIQLEQNEETRIQKMRSLGTYGATFHSNIQIIGVPEGEEEEQEMENLFEKNNGELSKSGKENRLPGSPGSSESPKEAGPKEAHTKAHPKSISQDETEGENLKSSKRKGDNYL